jgi:hypothetical protein
MLTDWLMALLSFFPLPGSLVHPHQFSQKSILAASFS